MSDGCPILESLSAATLDDDLTEGVQAYADQQGSLGISLVYTAFDAHLCHWLVVDVQSCISQLH